MAGKKQPGVSGRRGVWIASATDCARPPTSPVCSRTLKAPGTSNAAQQQTQTLDGNGGGVPKSDRDSRFAWLPQLLSLNSPAGI